MKNLQNHCRLFIFCLVICFSFIIVGNVNGQCSLPTLSVTRPQTFDSLTISWTGVSTNPNYELRASNDGGQTWQFPQYFSVTQGQQISFTTDHWGHG